MKIITKKHIDWLSLLDISGPFIGTGVLNRIFPNGLFALDRRLQDDVYEEYGIWKEQIRKNPNDLRHHRKWIEFILKNVLEYGEYLKDFMNLPRQITAKSSSGKILRPDYVLFNKTASLLVTVLSPESTLRKKSGHSDDKPLDEMRELLRASDVPVGLVTDGRIWTLVYSKPEEPTGYAGWDCDFWQEEKSSLYSFQNLLELRRFYGMAEEDTLPNLYEQSKNEQVEITRQLGEQVQRAVEVFIQNIDRINRDRNGKLLEGIPLIELYNSSLTFMMRIIFLFYAEENGLLFGNPKLGDRAAAYGVLNLRQELREIADEKGEEVLERRQDAYVRILSTCRAVFSGIYHEDLSMPAYGGSLFDPDRYPFLEGRKAGEGIHEANPLPIHNRTILHILEAIQTLRMKLGQGMVESRRISFRSLDVKQIGHVYEGLLDHTAKKAEDTLLKLQTKKDAEAIIGLTELEKEKAKGMDSFCKFLDSKKVKNLNQFRKNFETEKKDEDLRLLRSVCEGKEKLVKRISPFLDLLEEDTFGFPLVVVEKGVYVASGNERRSTGTHYTPEEISIPLVVHTLEPLLYSGPKEGKPREEWKIRKPEEILELKVCDSAMGSGAILVQVIRYLSEKLLESMDSHPVSSPRILPYGKKSEGDRREEFFSDDAERKKLQAKRLIADRCLYGVDINPMAVEMAKLSIWLETLDEGKPFSFLDHSFKCGDSLLGVTNIQLESFLGKQIVMETLLFRSFRGSVQIREELENTPDDTIESIYKKIQSLQRAEEALSLPRQTALLVTGAMLKGISADSFPVAQSEPEKLISSLDGKKPFIWHLEYPEVFAKGGFDAFVGNPPFMGGQKITGNMGDDYREYLVRYLAKSQRGSADLVAYFFLRNFSLLKDGGNFGLIATNTIAQGDTREAGLDQIVSGADAAGKGLIYRAVPSQKWPNAAAVYVATVWIHKGEDWKSGSVLVDEKGKENPTVSITSYLSQKRRVEGKPFQLKNNENKSFQGSIVLGMGFVLEPEEAKKLIQKDKKNKDCLYPYLNGEDLNSRPDQSPSRWVINFFDWPLKRGGSGNWNLTESEEKVLKNKKKPDGTPSSMFTFYQDPPEISESLSDKRKKWLREGIVPKDYPYPVAADYPDLLKIVEEKVKPERTRKNAKGEFALRYPLNIKWWIYGEKRPLLYSTIAGMERVVIKARVSPNNMFSYKEKSNIFSEQLVVLAIEGFQEFSVMQSELQNIWAWENASTMGDSTLRYSPTDCFENFPFPDLHSNSVIAQKLENIGKKYYELRQSIMKKNNEGLTKTYNRFHDKNLTPSPFEGEGHATVRDLRELHIVMDNAVRDAYGWNDLDLEHGFNETKQGIRFTVSEKARVEILDRLLELNHKRYAEEVAAGLHDKGKSKKGKKGAVEAGKGSVTDNLHGQTEFGFKGMK